MPEAHIPFRRFLGATLVALLGGCTPPAPPETPEPGADAGAEISADRDAECRRAFDEALARRAARAEAVINASALRRRVLAAAVARVLDEPPVAGALEAFGTAVLEAPAIRDEIRRVLLGAADDPGAQLAVVSALLGGGSDLRDQIQEAIDRGLTALSDADRLAGGVGGWLARPELGPLWDALLPAEPFSPALDAARGALPAARSVADARLRLTVPGDPEATRAAAESWAARPAGLGCEPLVRRFPLGETLADAPAVRTAVLDAVVGLLSAPAAREEAVTAARELLADAPFRLALDELIVQSLRDEDPLLIRRAAGDLLNSPAVGRTLAAAAQRLVARRAELPDLLPALARLADDADVRSALARFYELLVTSEGCIDL